MTTEAMVGSETTPSEAAALEVEEMVKSFVNLPAPGITGGEEERGGGRSPGRQQTDRLTGCYVRSLHGVCRLERWVELVREESCRGESQ